MIAVVGPSGAGKDSLIAGLSAARPDWFVVRRVITRPPDPETEAFESVDVDAFEVQRAAGAFCLSWGAHGLFYGIPKAALTRVQGGETGIVNLSRKVLEDGQAIFPNFVVLNITARPDVLADRLANRGRESAEAIAARLKRKVGDLPKGGEIHTIENNTSIAEAVEAALAALSQPVRA